MVYRSSSMCKLKLDRGWTKRAYRPACNVFILLPYQAEKVVGFWSPQARFLGIPGACRWTLQLPGVPVQLRQIIERIDTVQFARMIRLTKRSPAPALIRVL
jgi:hypothetical protein